MPSCRKKVMVALNMEEILNINIENINIKKKNLTTPRSLLIEKSDRKGRLIYA